MDNPWSARLEKKFFLKIGWLDPSRTFPSLGSSRWFVNKETQFNMESAANDDAKGGEGQPTLIVIYMDKQSTDDDCFLTLMILTKNMNIKNSLRLL